MDNLVRISEILLYKIWHVARDLPKRQLRGHATVTGFRPQAPQPKKFVSSFAPDENCRASPVGLQPTHDYLTADAGAACARFILLRAILIDHYHSGVTCWRIAHSSAGILVVCLDQLSTSTTAQPKRNIIFHDEILGTS